MSLNMRTQNLHGETEGTKEGLHKEIVNIKGTHEELDLRIQETPSQ
jgi:hypothetical protein